VGPRGGLNVLEKVKEGLLPPQTFEARLVGYLVPSIVSTHTDVSQICKNNNYYLEAKINPKYI
jgi:hypothetical protein